MYIIQIFTNFLLFIVSIFGILINRRNILVLIMCLEMMLLSVNLTFIVTSVYLDDIFGQIFSLFILTVAAAESAIGLAILILYYRLVGNVIITDLVAIRG